MNTLWMYDFTIFYSAAQAILHGLSPYTVDGFISPLPLALLFSPFTVLPMPWAYYAFVLINIVLLFWICRWNGLWAFLSFPVLYNLFTGQIDLLLALLIP